MLHIARLTERTGRYYVADIAAELEVGALGVADPLRPGGASGIGCDASTHGVPDAARGADRPGTWRGAVASGLGLRGAVGAAELAAVLSGAHPDTGRALTRRPTAVHGFDLTFSAPKSVSVLFGLSDAQRAAEILAAHRSAVDSALAYVEARAASVRRGSGEDRRVEPARGIVSASFTHGVSRALDPHLHTHVVVANLTHGADGRWTALDSRGLFAHRRAAGSLYDAELRHLLSTRLGLSWTRRQGAVCELAAVDPVLIGALSQRRAEIQAHLHEHVPSRAGTVGYSGRARAVAWAVTRDPKHAVRTSESLRARWARRASDAGWSGHIGQDVARDHPSHAAHVPHAARVARVGPPAAIDEHRFAASLELSAAGAVTRRDVLEAWATASTAGAAVRAVERSVDALAEWGDGVGVAEAVRSSRAVVVRPYLRRALGPRPSTPDALARWLHGAAAIDGYRERWRLHGAREPLGVHGSTAELSSMPVRRLAEHLAVTRELAEIRRQLGREVNRDVGRDPLAIERSLGIG